MASTRDIKSLTLVTSIKEKYEEIANLLSDLAEHIKLQEPHWETTPNPAQCYNVDQLQKLAISAVKEAYKHVESPCIVEYSALELPDNVFITGAQFHDIGEDELVTKYEGCKGRSCVVLAYCANGEDVSVFEGELEGSVVKPRGKQGHGWDRIWQPDGYSRTLAEMSSNKFIVNMRMRPYLELACLVRGRGYQGIFEIHVTVANAIDGIDGTKKFKEVCDRVGCKSLLIELPVGVSASQLMTSSYHRGQLKDVQLEAFSMSQALVNAGFNVTRVKIEAMMSNKEIPQTDSETSSQSQENYFEFHVKLLLKPGTDMKELQSLCNQFEARLSRNAFKVLEDGFTQQFVTLRIYRLGRINAEDRLNRCMKALQDAGHSIVSKQREYSVFDTNVQLDKGWIDKDKVLDYLKNVSHAPTLSQQLFNIRSS